MTSRATTADHAHTLQTQIVRTGRSLKRADTPIGTTVSTPATATMVCIGLAKGAANRCWVACLSWH
jgi:hypothetical protein